METRPLVVRWTLLLVMGLLWGLILVDGSVSIGSCSSFPGDLHIGDFHFRVGFIAFPMSLLLLVGALWARKRDESCLAGTIASVLVLICAANAADPVYSCFEAREGCETHRYFAGLWPEAWFDFKPVASTVPGAPGGSWGRAEEHKGKIEVTCLSESCAFSLDRSDDPASTMIRQIIALGPGDSFSPTPGAHFVGRGSFVTFRVCRDRDARVTHIRPHSDRAHTPWSGAGLIVLLLLHSVMLVLLMLGLWRLGLAILDAP